MQQSLLKAGYRSFLKFSFVVFLFLYTDAFATHFRYGSISWSKDAANPRTIHFKVIQSWRRGYNWRNADGSNPTNPNVGDVIRMGSDAQLHTGDGIFQTQVILTVTSVNTAEDWLYGEFAYDYTYPADGKYTAYFESCCRLSSPANNGKLQNNGDQSFRAECMVTVGNNNDAPVSSLPPYINMTTGLTAATYQIPAVDPNGDTLTFSIPPASSYTQSTTTPNSEPAGFTVSYKGLISFNTMGKAVGNLYNGIVRVADTKGAYIDLDFLIRITVPSRAPNFDYTAGNTPANNQVFNVVAGQSVTFSVKAKDPDAGDSVTLFGSGIPVGSVLTPGLPTTGAANASVQTTFSWTPKASQTGSYVVNFTAQDQQGVQTLTNITIVVSCNISVFLVDLAQPCRNASNGFLVVLARGTSPFQFSSDNGITYTASSDSVYSFTNLPVNTYKIVVKSANGCTSAPQTINLVSPDPISLRNAPAVKPVSCNGNTDGQIILSAAGGGAFLTYTLKGGMLKDSVSSYSGVFGGLAAGTYQYRISDRNNCQPVLGSTIVTEPAVLKGSISTQTNVDCNGNNTGTVTVAASGGTAPYTYSLNGISFVNTSTLGLLAAGSYVVTIKDAHGCNTTVPVTITQPSVLDGSIATQTNVDCHGSSTGSLKVAGSGGTSPYAYSINGTDFSNTSGSFSSLAAGNYTITVKDANGCTKTLPVSLSEPSALTATSTIGTITCHGGSTTLHIAASGGTPPYTNDGDHSVLAGAYSFTLTDAHSCSYTVSGTLTEPEALTATVNTGTISCHGGTATVDISASGGTPPYANTGAHTVPAGPYSFVITDASQCSYTVNGTMTEPDVLTAAVTEGSISCHGGNAVVSVTASGGTPPYSNDGNHTVAAGPYSFTVTDAHNCSYTVSGVITEPAELTATATAGSIACHGGTTTVTIAARGGTPPYSNAGAHTVPAGPYSFTVIDANQCSYSVSGTIAEPANALTASVTQGTIACHGGSTTVSITVNGGTPPYTNAGVHTVFAGPYSFTITDANLCSYVVTGTILEPAALVSTISTNNAALLFGYTGNQTATITAQAKGGVAPYRISITMNRPLKCNSVNDAGDEGWTAGPGTSSSANTACPANPLSNAAVPVSTAVIIAANGSYAVTVALMADADFTATITDANGCVSTATTHIHAEDVRCFAGNGKKAKIAVCHRTGSTKNPTVQLCVDPSEVPDHLSHGDVLGTCTSNFLAPSVTSAAADINMITENAPKVAIQAFPNPNNGQFTMKFDNFNVQKASVEILNANGLVLEERQINLNGKGQVISFAIKSRSAGVYLVRVTSQEGTHTVKVIVQQ